MAVRSWRQRQADRETIVQEHHHHSASTSEVPDELMRRLDAIETWLASADRRHIEQEKIIQTVIQAADTLLQRLQSAEGRLEQHKGVINDNSKVVAALQESLALLGNVAQEKLSAA